MKIERINEETDDGNYVIEISDQNLIWKYITTEFNISAACGVMCNLHNATGLKCRVLSRRSDNQILAEL